MAIFCALHLHSTGDLAQEVENARWPAYRQAIVACIAGDQFVISLVSVATQKSLLFTPYLAVGGGILSWLIYPASDDYSDDKFSAFCDIVAFSTCAAGYEGLTPAIFATKFLVDGLGSISKTAKFWTAIIAQKKGTK